MAPGFNMLGINLCYLSETSSLMISFHGQTLYYDTPHCNVSAKDPKMPTVRLTTNLHI